MPPFNTYNGTRAPYGTEFSRKMALQFFYLQRVSMACYAERCNDIVRPRPPVCILSKCLKLRSCGLRWRIAPWL